MLKLEDFFGLKIEDERSDMSPLLESLGLENEIEGTKVVQQLSKLNGRDAAIVNVARRQQVLKLVKPMLNGDMLDHDPTYYIKEINTSSDHDRRYAAEDRLLEFVLLVCSGKSKKIMAEDPHILTAKQLREAVFIESRFERCWDILSEDSTHTVNAYRKTKK